MTIEVLLDPQPKFKLGRFQIGKKYPVFGKDASVVTSELRREGMSIPMRVLYMTEGIVDLFTINPELGWVKWDTLIDRQINESEITKDLLRWRPTPWYQRLKRQVLHRKLV